MCMPPTSQSRSALVLGMVAALGLVLALCAPVSAADPPDSSPDTTLDRGFVGLYNLDFSGRAEGFFRMGGRAS